MDSSRIDAIVCDAVRARRLLRFVYDGYERVVEPHAYGVNTQGHAMLSCWLVGGWSRSEAAPGWRNYLASAMRDVGAMAEAFDGARPGYNPRDDAFVRVRCALPAPAATTVRRLLARIDSAWREGRWDELAACFDPHMVIDAPAFGVRIESREACARSFRTFMEHATLVRYEADEPRVDVWEDTAVGTFAWTMAWTTTDGAEGSASGHDSFACRRGADGEWRAVWRTIVPRS